MDICDYLTYFIFFKFFLLPSVFMVEKTFCQICIHCCH